MTAESLTNTWKVCHSDTEKAQCGTSLLQSVSSISYGRETRFPYITEEKLELMSQ